MISSTGSVARLIRARRQLRANITIMMPISVTMSARMSTRPWVRNSFSASTSLVRRVSRRPTGLRSKKPRLMRWMWRKICTRMDCITVCPTLLMM